MRKRRSRGGSLKGRKNNRTLKEKRKYNVEVQKKEEEEWILINRRLMYGMKKPKVFASS